MSFISALIDKYDGILEHDENGWSAKLMYGKQMALCVPMRGTKEEAIKDVEDYAQLFGWKITWKAGK